VTPEARLEPMGRNFHFQLILIILLIASLACSMADDLTNNTAGEKVNPSKEVEDMVLEDESNEADNLSEATLENNPEEQKSEQDNETVLNSGSKEYDTVFPLPEDVENFTGQGGETQINFQTNLSIEEVIDYYRQALTKENLYERDTNTNITDTAFSMIFDGHGNGKALVIQGVDIGNGKTNINIRFEEK
jgi:septal ring-binding cell division protein DamX